MKKYKAKLHEAYGAVMKEYVAVPESVLVAGKIKELQKYVAISFGYANVLKAKPTKKK